MPEAIAAVAAPAPVVHADPAVTGPLADAGVDDKAAKEAQRSEKQKAAEAKAERKESILETLAKNKAKAAAEPAEKPKAEPAAKPDKPAPIEEVAKLNAKVRELTKKLEAYGDKKPGESKADLLAAIKKDPTVLFTELADEPELMVKLAEARQKQLAAMDPRERELAELRDKQKAIEDKLAEADRIAEQAKSELQSKNVYDATAKVLAEGFKNEAGETLFDHTPYGYCRAFTEAGEVDAPALAMESTTEMIRDLVGLDENGKPLRAPTEKETATILSICFDKIEARLRKLGQISRAVDAKSAPAVQKTQKTEVKERPQERRPPTIASAMGRGGQVPVMRAPETKKERKAAILNRLATAKRQEAR